MSLKVAHAFGLSLNHVRTLPPSDLALYVGFLKVKHEEEEKEIERLEHERKMKAPPPPQRR